MKNSNYLVIVTTRTGKVHEKQIRGLDAARAYCHRVVQRGGATAMRGLDGPGYCPIGCECQVCQEYLLEQELAERNLQGQRENDAYDSWKDDRW